MPLINVTFVCAVHTEILLQTKIGHPGYDLPKLESVLGRVDQQIYYNHIEDLFEIAAWYGIAIAKGHAFVDANKRTALAVMLAYLETQGISIPPNHQLDDLMVDIVESRLHHEQLAKAVADFLYVLYCMGMKHPAEDPNQ